MDSELPMTPQAGLVLMAVMVIYYINPVLSTIHDPVQPNT